MGKRIVLKEDINYQINKLDTLSNAGGYRGAQTLLTGALRKINDSLGKELRSNYVSIINNLSMTYGSVCDNIEETQKLLIKCRDTFINLDSAIRQEIQSSGELPIDGTTIGDNTSNQTVYKLPDWARQTTGNPEESYTENGKKQGVVKNNVTGELSCTYYTLRKLRERGLGFPFKGPYGANGANWYTNCSDSVPRFEGSDCLTNMYKELGSNVGSLNNVVLSFNKPSPWGHVVLIDKLYKDSTTGELKIVFSDQYPPIYDVNGSNPARELSLDDFKKSYKGYNGDFLGAVYIGD